MIEILGLAKTYGTKVAVADVSFTVPPGTITGFVGPNGAGKTTVLRMVAGLARPDAGTIRVAEAQFAQLERPASTMGVFISADWIPPQCSPLGFLEYICDTQGISRQRERETVDLVGLSHVASRRVRSFSLGMRQRLGIGAAIVCQPQILVLDEPVNGLDPDGIHWFRSFIANAAKAGVTVLLSSHHMLELATIVDRVVMLKGGSIAAQGNLEEFVATDKERPVYIESPDIQRVLNELEANGIEAHFEREGALVHGISALEVGRHAFQSGAGLSHLSETSRSLEETYFDLLSN